MVASSGANVCVADGLSTDPRAVPRVGAGVQECLQIPPGTGHQDHQRSRTHARTLPGRIRSYLRRWLPVRGSTGLSVCRPIDTSICCRYQVRCRSFYPGTRTGAQMGYPQQYPPQGQPPIDNNMTMSIVSIFLFWPLAIPAIIAASKVNPALQAGDYFLDVVLESLEPRDLAFVDELVVA